MKQKLLNSILLLITVILLPLSAWADPGTSTFYIGSLKQSDNTGNLYVLPVGNVEVLNATCTKETMYAVNVSATSFSSVSSMLFMAAAANKPIKVWIADSADDCLSAYQRITVVEVLF